MIILILRGVFTLLFLLFLGTAVFNPKKLSKRELQKVKTVTLVFLLGIFLAKEIAVLVLALIVYGFIKEKRF